MSPELLTALLGAGGVAALVPKLVDGLKSWRSGRAEAEKRKNQRLSDRMTAAEGRLELEIYRRRAMEEYAAVLRRLLIEDCGIEAGTLPDWPSRPPD